MRAFHGVAAAIALDLGTLDRAGVDAVF